MEGQGEGGRGGAPRAGKYGRRFTAAERRELVDAFARSGKRVREFCAERGLSTATLCKWRRLAKGGPEALETRKNPGNAKGRTRRPYTPEERRRAMEALERSGRTMADFAKLWGVTDTTLKKWRVHYRTEGPKGLEGKRAGPKGPRAKMVPALKAEVTGALRRFPGFGLRRIRDFLLRFRGVKASVPAVRRVRREAGMAAPERPKAKRKPREWRRFERAKPMQLWQSDLTSYVLPRPGRRVYLVVFLDDHSRYVVAFGLHLQQRHEIVVEALLQGITRFGKPEEVLTDQGRQYFAWRGKSAFEKLLEKEGIRHVVSRSHHPQTLGKCERLWETVRNEYWDRRRPDELEEAREGLGHYFAHYNHSRPHQGLDGLAPADRFFGVESEVRKAVEAQAQSNELELALGRAPRPVNFLLGTLDGKAVALREEGGRMVLEREVGDGGGEEDAGIPEAAIQAGPGDALADPGALGGGVGGGEEGGARDGGNAPGVVAGPCEQVGGGGEAEGAAAAGVAAQPTGAGGDGGGPAETAAVAEEGGAADGRGRRPEGDAEGERGVEAEAGADGEPGEAVAGSAGEPGTEGPAGGSGEEAPEAEKGGAARAGFGSGSGC